MRYFKCKARMEQKIKPETEKGESAMEQLAEKSVTYIEKNSSGCLGCITSVYKKECTFIFAGNGDDAQIEQEIAAFWDFIGIEGEILEKTETCAANIYRVLRMARVDLPNNFDELFDVEYSRSIDADEHIAAAPEDLTLAAYAEANHFPELYAEAERIAAAKDSVAFYGHPVHYILEENNSEKAKQTVDLLVQTLYRANRLQSARIIIIDEQSFGMTLTMQSGLNVDMDGISGAMMNGGSGGVVNNYYNNDNSRTVNQTNNSPKSLSRLGIYRQTRNALNV